MDPGEPEPLASAEIHGFQSTADLNLAKLSEDACTRWFRANEVHAILSNHNRFKIEPQPFHMPESGTVLLFDRKVLRNFRKDGHNWKKKKDGKTVQEAHEKLKIGNQERIHVYYARNEDDPFFYRRCYWLLDKNLERIVLVHYRRTSEEDSLASAESEEDLSLPAVAHRDSPIATGASTSTSSLDPSTSAVLSEEISSDDDHGIYNGYGTSQVDESNEFTNHELILQQINTLDWNELLVEPVNQDVATSREGDVSASDQITHQGSTNSYYNGCLFQSEDKVGSSLDQPNSTGNSNCINSITPKTVKQPKVMENEELQSLLISNSDRQSSEFSLNLAEENKVMELQSQDTFAEWASFGTSSDLQLDSPFACKSDLPGYQHSIPQCIFHITEISPAWGYSAQKTKVLIVGSFHESRKQLTGSAISCTVGRICVPLEMVQAGVYRFFALPQMPGLVDLYLTLDGHTPISQILSFEYRPISGSGISSEVENDEAKSNDMQIQLRLAHLLFSTTDNISIFSSRIKPNNLKEAKKYVLQTSPVLEKDWSDMVKLSANNGISPFQVNQGLFELILKNKLQEWLLEKILDGHKTTPRDSQGQGVIHLCAILDYAWAVRLFSLSGMSLDFRDKCGWTALHWAAFYGREKMVAVLLTAGANPSFITDPTPESPGGLTAADLASKQGHEGLGAYLAEKGLTAHFRAMSLSGNATGMVRSSSSMRDSAGLYSEDISEQDLCLKDTLAGYRNAAEAADRIQTAFRERTLKQQARAVELIKPELEAKAIISALKIQQAYRSFNRRKMMKAASRIQGCYRTWQARRNFLNMRKQTIRIQAAFRGYQARRQYGKIVWSVGILEKAVLRWRLKKKGLRGLQIGEATAMEVDKEKENPVEEDFFRISREQAEERVKRSVVRVQAMFRSYQAQQEYRRMKLAYEKAKLEFGEPDNN